MKLKKIEHIAINTKNIEASSAFYREVLGLKQLDTIDNGDSAITYFQLPGGARLELFDCHGRNNSVERGENTPGLRHIAFEVEDVARHERELREKGANIIMEATALQHLGIRVLLFADPDGVIIEFCEKL